ncbi:MAG TPA: YebC/PmpR family DNA-binding transcriptional regulator [Candidatus Dormibacteraeota bacterium]|jgi:YebC/PmpR family DNA-binding regulatory protein|nr:YebC/PmpR family DNA-binding transcriptional regulator [Candidatus Dormibacteraeota bacterium]
MSGHSKWATIKHKKAATDAKKGIVFTKMAREIAVAAKEGGGDAGANFRLRLAIQKAREVNMPADNIDRAIKRGTGESGGASYEELRYEGYGPGGVAIMVDALTDNRNRTASEIRQIFGRHGGSIAEQGAVGWIFKRKGQLLVDPGQRDADEMALEVIELGASDVVVSDGQLEVETEPEDFEAVRDGLEKAGAKIVSAELTMSPSTTIAVTDEGEAAKLLRLMEALEDSDDAQQVYANFDIDAAQLERLSEAV